MSRERFWEDVSAEVDRARAKFPNPRLLLSAMTEEHGELVKSVLDKMQGKASEAHVYGEAVQLVAMVVRLIEEGDPLHELAPIALAEDQGVEILSAAKIHELYAKRILKDTTFGQPGIPAVIVAAPKESRNGELLMEIKPCMPGITASDAGTDVFVALPANETLPSANALYESVRRQVLRELIRYAFKQGQESMSVSKHEI